MKTATFVLLSIALASTLAACKPKAAAPAPVTLAGASAKPSAPADSTASKENRPDRGPGRVDPAQRAKERFEQLKSELALTDDQSQKVQAIMDQQVASMQALRADQSLDRTQRTAKFQEARQAFNSQIEELLTPEQKPKWEELKKKREAEMAERRGRRQQGGGGPPLQ